MSLLSGGLGSVSSGQQPCDVGRELLTCTCQPLAERVPDTQVAVADNDAYAVTDAVRTLDRRLQALCLSGGLRSFHVSRTDQDLLRFRGRQTAAAHRFCKQLAEPLRPLRALRELVELGPGSLKHGLDSLVLSAQTDRSSFKLSGTAGAHQGSIVLTPDAALPAGAERIRFSLRRSSEL